MKYWKKNIIGILCVLLLTNIATAGVVLTATPVGSDFVIQGGEIEYYVTITVEEEGLGSDWQEEFFSVSEVDKQPGWNYDFDPESVMVYDNPSESQTSILTMSVPIDAPIGDYTHRIEANGYDEIGQMIGLVTEFDLVVVNTPVEPIPELNSLWLTSGGLLGLLLFYRRTKN